MAERFSHGGPDNPNGRRRLRRSTLLPLVLLLYLGFMASIGYKDYAAGKTSAAYFFGIIGATLVVIVALHFFLKKKEKLRDQRLADIEKSGNLRDEKDSEHSA